MSPLDYIRIDVEILSLKISDKAKLLLGLVKRFNRKGLIMSNSEIAELLNASPKHVTRLPSELHNHIQIKSPQSRYRKIFYCRNNAEVETNPLPQNSGSKNPLLPHTGDLLPQNCGDTSALARNKIKGIQKTTYTTYPFQLRNNILWYLPKEKFNSYLETYKGIDVEKELRKAAQWLTDNPKRRKTSRGMPRFINGWLSRAKPEQAAFTAKEPTEEADELLAEIKR